NQFGCSRPRRPRVFGRLRRIAQHGFVNDSVVTANDIKFRFPKLAADQSDYAGAENNDRKRRMEKEDRHESERGEHPHDFVLERFAPDLNDCNGDDSHDRGLQSVKDRRDQRDMAEGSVNITERPKNEDRWEQEKRAGDDAAPSFVQEPADINRELDRFGSG